MFNSNLKSEKYLAYTLRFFTYPWGSAYPRLGTAGLDHCEKSHKINLPDCISEVIRPESNSTKGQEPCPSRCDGLSIKEIDLKLID